MEKIIERSGLGDETGLSDGILAMKENDEMSTSLKDAMDETQMVIFDVAGNLLRKANVSAQEARLPKQKFVTLRKGRHECTFLYRYTSYANDRCRW